MSRTMEQMMVADEISRLREENERLRRMDLEAHRQALAEVAKKRREKRAARLERARQIMLTVMVIVAIAIAFVTVGGVSCQLGTDVMVQKQKLARDRCETFCDKGVDREILALDFVNGQEVCVCQTFTDYPGAVRVTKVEKDKW